ncbi:hypothetical protein [Streptomyces sp. NPDC001068]|uniref:TetR/AcrR family transcriptional regulator n=1 Tax=Streptomyces sp. NPDC001068 TaxID=3364544 RepID=UPI0036BC7B83
MMRSMLTEQTAADHVRASLGRQINSVGAAVSAPEDPEPRATPASTLLGVTIGRQLLSLAALREAPADHIATPGHQSPHRIAGVHGRCARCPWDQLGWNCVCPKSHP